MNEDIRTLIAELVRLNEELVRFRAQLAEEKDVVLTVAPEFPVWGDPDIEDFS